MLFYRHTLLSLFFLLIQCSVNNHIEYGAEECSKNIRLKTSIFTSGTSNKIIVLIEVENIGATPILVNNLNSISTKLTFSANGEKYDSHYEATISVDAYNGLKRILAGGSISYKYTLEIEGKDIWELRNGVDPIKRHVDAISANHLTVRYWPAYEIEKTNDYWPDFKSLPLVQKLELKWDR